MNLEGYRNLSRLITRGRRNAEKGDCQLTVGDIGEFAGDLLAVVPTFETTSNAVVQTYADIFRERAYLAAAVHLGPCDDTELERCSWQSRQCRLPLVATNQVHYHVPKRCAS